MVLSCVPVQGQTLLPKFGVALSTISLSKDFFFSESYDIKNKLGIVGGLGFELMLGEKMALQPELLFYQKGYKTQSKQSNITYETTLTLNYVELPLLFKVKVGSYYVNAGPSIALGVGGKYKNKVSGPFTGSSFETKVKFGKEPDNNTSSDLYVDNNIDLGLQIGGGYIIADVIMIDLRYGFGLTNIWDKDASIGYNDNKSKLKSFQVTMGVPIRLRRK
jgi:outer membrane protein with beta-barrel domain